MTEMEGQAFFKEELRLLENLAENSKRQMHKLEKRLWVGLRRLSEERDGYLRLWQERKSQREEAWKVGSSSLQALREQVRSKQAEVERLHAELMQETECAKRVQALKLQQVNKGQVMKNQYEGPAPTSIRWNIQG
ncbi:hypothetical protein [Anaeromusa acidaminophila]|uniref:hypothetical protein n=1 Tax=Anaeromusa acidaminophila TaxID=81464 RepID=UPI00037BA756|nr:hypothetical protein [Anaeromusa acidaminophila]